MDAAADHEILSMFLYKTYAFEDKATIVFKDPHIQTGLSDSSSIAESVFVALNTPKSPMFYYLTFCET